MREGDAGSPANESGTVQRFASDAVRETLGASTDIDSCLALAAAGLSGARIELHTAVAALIRNPALIARWRAGRQLIR